MGVLVGVNRSVGGAEVDVLVGLEVAIVVRVTVAFASNSDVDEGTGLGLGMVAVGVESGNRTEQPLTNNIGKITET
jgi:hypothetical protein